MKSRGADVFIHASTPRFAVQAIRRAAEIGWKPLQYLATVSTSVSAVLEPAGFEHGQGINSSMVSRDPADPAIHGSHADHDCASTILRFYPGGDPAATQRRASTSTATPSPRPRRLCCARPATS